MVALPWVVAIQGCSSPAAKAVNGAGGRFEDLGFGQLLTEDVYFFKESQINDARFARIYPSILELKVEFLTFDNVPITDATMRLVRQLPDLKCLVLNRANVTFAGVECLQGMNRLQQIYLSRSEWTPEEVTRLRKDMSHVEIQLN